MKHSNRWLATAVLALLYNVGAGAAEPGFYLSATAGWAEEDPKSAGANFVNSDGVFHFDPVNVEIDDGKFTWGVAIGYQINSFFAVEMEYVDFGKTTVVEDYVAEVPELPFVPPTNMSLGYSSRVTGPTLSLLGTFPVGDSLQFYLRGGAMFASREVDVAFDAANEKFSDTVWLAGAGVAWAFADRWAIRAEVQQTGTFGKTILAGETKLRRVSLGVLFDL